MGKHEDIVLDYLSQPEVFAALFNGYVFDGRQVIEPEALKETDNKLRLFLADDKGKEPKNTFEVMKKERDIVREFQIADVRIRLAILGVEHQSEVDYSMALRTSAYDILEYLKQAREIQRQHKKLKDVKGKEYLSGFSKEDRLIPTISLVFYTGQEEWDAAMDLQELCVISPYLENMKPFMLSAPLNLISVYNVKDTEKYSGSLKQIFDLLHYVDDGNAMMDFVKNHEEDYCKLDEAAMRLLAELIHLELPKKEAEGEEEEDNMCKALEDIKQMGVKEGLERGLERGLEQGQEQLKSIIRTMLSKGMTCEEISDLTDIPLDRVQQVESSVVE